MAPNPELTGKYQLQTRGTTVTKAKVMWKLSKLHAPFKSCAPHPSSSRMTRQLVVDTKGETERPEIKEVRELFGRLEERFQILCNHQEKSKLSNFYAARPLAAPRKVLFVQNPAFPAPKAPKRGASLFNPMGSPTQSWVGKENIPPNGKLYLI